MEENTQLEASQNTQPEEHIVNVYEVKEEDGEFLVYSGEYEAARNFIGNTAFLFNEGRFQYWIDDPFYYYDCGPVTYYTKEWINMGLPAEENKKGSVKKGK